MFPELNEVCDRHAESKRAPTAIKAVGNHGIAGSPATGNFRFVFSNAGVRGVMLAKFDYRS